MNAIYSILQSIGFDWQVALANLVNFLIIVWLIRRFAWKPIQSKLKERQMLITQGLEDAQNAEKKLRDATDEADSIRKQATAESSQTLASAHEERKAILSKAEQEAIDRKAHMTTEALNQIEKQKEEEMKAFKDEASALFEDVARKIFAEELSDEAKQAYAKKAAHALNR